MLKAREAEAKGLGGRVSNILSFGLRFTSPFLVAEAIIKAVIKCRQDTLSK
jgi:hypothetical protein